MGLRLDCGFNLELDEKLSDDEIYYMYKDLALDIASDFSKEYRKFESLEAMISNIDTVFSKFLFDYAKDLHKFLINMKIFNYELDDIISNVNKDISDSYEEKKILVYKFLDEIEETSNYEDLYRKSRKDSRGKFWGIGTEGIVKASALNLATGMVHGIFNSVAKGISSMAHEKEKKKYLDKMESEFEREMYCYCIGLYDSFVDITIEEDHDFNFSYEVEERMKKAETIITNALNNINNKDMIFEYAVKSLQVQFSNNITAFSILFDRFVTANDAGLMNLINLDDFYEDEMEFLITSDCGCKKCEDLFKFIITADHIEDSEKKHSIYRVISIFDKLIPNEIDRVIEDVAIALPNKFLAITSTPDSLGNSFIKHSVELYKKLGKKPFGSDFYCLQTDGISDSILNNAISKYGLNLTPNEKIIFLCNLGRKGEEGFFITDRYYYAHHDPSNRFRLDKITDMKLNYDKFMQMLTEENNYVGKTVDISTIENKYDFLNFIRAIIPSLRGDISQEDLKNNLYRKIQ